MTFCMLDIEDRAKAIVDSLASMQAWITAVGNQVVTQHVWVDELPLPKDCENYELQEYLDYSPFVVITTLEHRSVYDATHTYLPAGALVFSFEERHPTRAKKGRTTRNFKKSVSDIVNEFASQSTIDGGFQPLSILSPEQALQQMHDDELSTMGAGWRWMLVMPFDETTGGSEGV